MQHVYTLSVLSSALTLLPSFKCTARKVMRRTTSWWLYKYCSFRRALNFSAPAAIARFAWKWCCWSSVIVSHSVHWRSTYSLQSFYACNCVFEWHEVREYVSVTFILCYVVYVQVLRWSDLQSKEINQMSKELMFQNYFWKIKAHRA
jgi:hypothetical protein